LIFFLLPPSIEELQKDLEREQKPFTVKYTLDAIVLRKKRLCIKGYSGKNKDYVYSLPLIVNVKGKDNVTVNLDVDALQDTE
jgi:hypothetical protein